MNKNIITIYSSIALCLFIFMGNAGAAEEALYKIGINDMIHIKVLDHDELTTLATVSSDGNITFPYIGTVHVKDMSPSEIEKEITSRLSEGYIKYPVVSVSLMKSLSRNIYLYGEVHRRGAIPYEEKMTIVTVLSIAGGITDDGLYGEMKVRRKQKGTAAYRDIPIDIDRTIEGNVKGDMLLEPDDIIIVGRNKEFFLHGEVASPGKKRLEKGMTVLRALSAAGGLSANGLYGKVKVRRKQKQSNEYHDIPIDLSGTLKGTVEGDMLLEPGDDVIVERNETFSTQGEVANRGRFTLEDNMTVLKALSQAGGVTKDGLYGRIKVRRRHEASPGGFMDFVESQLNDGVVEDRAVEETILEPDDVIVVERNKTILIQGAVVTLGRAVLEKDMTVLRAVLQAGGVTKDGLNGRIKVRRKHEESPGGYRDLIESKLDRGIIQDSAVEDTILESDDIVVVEPNKTFLIYGEVNKVGEYVLDKDMTVLKAITIAGGFTKWGSENKVKILRSKADKSGVDILKVNIKNVLDGDAGKDIALEDGDVVVVTAGIF